MFWSKHKQILKDKEAGLVFNWRHPISLKYPLFLFLFLSLLAHFLFLHLFQLPSLENKPFSQKSGTLFYLNEEGGPVTQRLLSLIQNRGALIPRGVPDVDPLAKGIDDQLSQPLTAGLLDWSPTPARYPDLPFNGGGRSEIVWKHTLPPMTTDLLVPIPQSSPKEKVQRAVRPHFVSLPPELSKILDKPLPEWKSKDSFYGQYMKLLVVVSPQGQVTLVTPLKTSLSIPLNEPEEEEEAFRQTERWIRSLPWKISPDGGKGIVSLEWKEDQP